MEKPKRIHIYYDDGCPMCTAFAQVIVKSNTTQTVVKVSSSEYSTSIPKTELLREIHLIEEDGTIRKGADAVLTSLTQIYPWLTPLKHAVRMPVINQLVNLVYLFISKKELFGMGVTILVSIGYL
jgi:predicted DCC family thiol-disulfide oxidoreductase YuxK